MIACTDAKVENLGSVIPRCDSQNSNPVGVHWFRSSFDYNDLESVKAWVTQFYGEGTLKDYGHLRYGRHYAWKSGVSLCFDSDPDLNPKPLQCTTIDGEKVEIVFPQIKASSHRGRMTLDIPGKACDELTDSDLLLFMEGCQELGCTCKRIDVFWDDYNRTVSLEKLRIAAKKNDFSMFQITSENRTRSRIRKENDGLIYDAVTFGRRGCKGSGKYLRVYDKNLETKGESDCIRWECEFSQDKAQKVFTWLIGACGNVDVFASLCGALIGGCIKFVHRTGNKHIDRLNLYDWWKDVTELLGVVSVRVAKKVNTLTGTIEWVEHQVSPSLALIRKAMKSEPDFYNLMCHLLDVGESRMNNNQRQIAEQKAGCLVFDRKFNKEKQDWDYLSAMCIQIN